MRSKPNARHGILLQICNRGNVRDQHWGDGDLPISRNNKGHGVNRPTVSEVRNLCVIVLHHHYDTLLRKILTLVKQAFDEGLACHLPFWSFSKYNARPDQDSCSYCIKTKKLISLSW